MKLYLLLPLICCFSFQLYQQTPIKTDSVRLAATMKQLSTFGKTDLGQPNRVAFSDGDLKAREYVIEIMRSAGLQTRVDAAGNIIGRRNGTKSNLKPIAFGSHIDMVPLGGNYDGCVGSMAAIEVIRTLNDRDIRTSHPLEVIIFSNEEGGVMGSRAMVGALGKNALSVVNSTGYSMGEGIQRLGGDTTQLASARREKGSLAAFVELHIEQGGILDTRKLDIGIVEGIVGLNWWDVHFKGMANHAGTTPLDLRKDALLAAARFIEAVNEEARALSGQQVATVGRIKAFPGVPNVIPGEVVLSLEIRDLSTEVIEQLFGKIKARADGIAEQSGVAIEFKALDTTGKPALTSEAIQKAIESVADNLGLSHLYMRSGAGHDAQDIALIAPVGMIFVPSKGGISHSPDEFTSVEDMANGANVLLNTILKLDKQLN
ncbi:Zn-dependent hydrolase [Robiginitalea sp. IMCC43444]|uniref:Zn-dependent hydrolase n=1 Tax=Robiginitalea sp. IMCC43444 TaxID=3459121 RepID=UPI004041A25A